MDRITRVRTAFRLTAMTRQSKRYRYYRGLQIVLQYFAAREYCPANGRHLDARNWILATSGVNSREFATSRSFVTRFSFSRLLFNGLQLDTGLHFHSACSRLDHPITEHERDELRRTWAYGWTNSSFYG